jgi:hypothetical protein
MELIGCGIMSEFRGTKCEVRIKVSIKRWVERPSKVGWDEVRGRLTELIYILQARCTAWR